MINESVCDARTPRNLHDEDFGPDSAFLPPSRPLSEITPILYVVTKAELSAVFRAVYMRVVLGRTDSYDEIMSLHRRLEAAYQSVSPRFRGFSLEDFVTVAPYIMVRRYTLEMLYQKTMCMLHRHYMTLSFRQPEYNFSRLCCVDASMAILSHHTAIFRQMQLGGSYCKNATFVSSLEQADFLLASIIICVELSSRSRSHNPRGGEVVDKYRQEDLMEALKKAHECLAGSRDKSSECRQAFGVLSAMLRRFSESVGDGQANQGPAINVDMAAFPGDVGEWAPSISSGRVLTTPKRLLLSHSRSHQTMLRRSRILASAQTRRQHRLPRVSRTSARSSAVLIRWIG